MKAHVKNFVKLVEQGRIFGFLGGEMDSDWNHKGTGMRVFTRISTWQNEKNWEAML